MSSSSEYFVGGESRRRRKRSKDEEKNEGIVAKDLGTEVEWCRCIVVCKSSGFAELVGAGVGGAHERPDAHRAGGA